MLINVGMEELWRRGGWEIPQLRRAHESCDTDFESECSVNPLNEA